MRNERIAPERRHTLYFLREIRAIAPVFLDTDVDMSAVLRHRSVGRKYSLVSYVLYAAARVLAAHPQANAAISHRGHPRITRYTSVNGKLTLDKTLNGERIVLSTVLPNLQESTLEEIQRQVAHYRDGDPATMPEFHAVRLVHRLPWPIGSVLFRLGVRPLSRRAATLGTFAVTSLGHRPVDGFYSVGGTTLTLGLGRITDRPVARDQQVMIAPLMRVTLAFDHRVIDGAEAADVLTDLKDALEGWEYLDGAQVTTVAEGDRIGAP
jgi:pyruvate/2-oxoglutarate dehydrogenase complex dihydrolipoamide acyltransferase (E2) component